MCADSRAVFLIAIATCTLLVLGIGQGMSHAGVNQADKCLISKLKEAAKYDACRLKALAKEVSKSAAADYTKCASKFSSKWQKIETKGDGLCVTDGDESAIDSAITTYVDTTFSNLGGTPLSRAVNQAEKCLIGKVKEVAKFDTCRLKAYGKHVAKGIPADFAKCDSKFSSKWQKVEAKGDGLCFTNGDESTVAAAVVAQAASLFAALGGAPSCGNDIKTPDEACDGNDAAACPGLCQTDCTCAATCPVGMTLAINAGGDGSARVSATRLEEGFGGLGHNKDYPAGGTIDLLLSCGAGTPPCGTCNITGIDPLAGDCRCDSDPSIACDTVGGIDNDDCSGGNCSCYSAPPVPASASGISTCEIRTLTADITGIVDIESGAMSLTLAESNTVHLDVSLLSPCPVCVGDVTVADGVKDGICSGGSRDGLACDADGVEAALGTTSLDCLPDGGLAVGEDARTFDLTTGASSLPVSESCGGFLSTLDCACRVCTGGGNIPCSSDGDCPGAETCSSNGSGVAQLAPNGCSTDFICNSGECNVDTVSYCDAVVSSTGGGVLPCNDNTDCAFFGSECPGNDCGACALDEARKCFASGTGGETIDATGSADFASPTLVTTFCRAPAASSGVNSSVGLPGPVRWTLDSNRVYQF
jgi:hypothetical protein